ncbi:MAG TPA: LysR family transcriptional regulator [Gaiellaceae bacterium]
MLERWLRIELRHLFALEAVAEQGSFSAAGDRLGYVQSAVSHQIAALESIVGKRLVERSRGTRPVSLTPEGEALYRHAKTILARVRAAEADLADDGDSHSLRVASFQTISSRIVSRVLQRLDGEVCVELVEGTTEVGLLDRLTEGELDAVFTEGPLEPGPFAAETLFADPYVLVAPASSAIALEGAPLSLHDVARLPLVGHSAERPRLERHFAARGLRARYVVRSDVNSTIQALVRTGIAYAVVPRFSVDETDGEIAVIPLDPVDAIEPRVMLVAWNSDRTLERPIAAFVDATRAVCAELDLVVA